MTTGAIVPPASRNSPCPCGSGQRYKNCHGALAEGQGAESAKSPAARTSAYRAPAREWPDLSEEEQDRLGAVMERALAHQLAERVKEAARDYRTVLERAPDTHDALHMLGVIELGRENLDESEQLIRRAMTVRPAYPAIVRNLKLVEDAKLAHRRESPELLCERALPIFSDLVLAGSRTLTSGAGGGRTNETGPDEIHLIGRIHAGPDDDGWLLRRLAQFIEGRVWAIDSRGTGRIGDRPWHGIDAEIGSYPRSGTHVIVGVDTENVSWLDHVLPSRVIVFCSGVAPSTCLDQLRRIARDGAQSVELVFFSSLEAARFGAGHRVITPPVALPMPRLAKANPPSTSRGVFRIGVVGQSGHAVLETEEGDAMLRMRDCADELLIYDPGRLRFAIGDARKVTFLARTPDGLDSFLSELDVLVMRPRAWYYEGGAREFFTARACGIPVLCPGTSRWAEYVEHGADGLLYETDEQLLSLLSDLRVAPDWAADLGAAARVRTLSALEPARIGRAYTELLRGSSNLEVAGEKSTPRGAAA